jgi:predicted acetyltransferase
LTGAKLAEEILRLLIIAMRIGIPGVVVSSTVSNRACRRTVRQDPR